MNQDVIRMAREAGFGDGIVEFIGVQTFERFAALVADAEREACAKVCEDLAQLNRTSPTDSMWEQEECAAAIRAIGETK